MPLPLTLDHHVGGAQVDADLQPFALSPFRSPLDPGASSRNFLSIFSLAAVYVVRATYGGDAFRGQSRQDKRTRRPQIADLDISAVEPCRAADRGVVLIHDLDLGAHAAQLARATPGGPRRPFR